MKLSTWQRWRLSKGYSLRDRVIYAVPMCWLTGPAAAVNWIAAALEPVDQFCRRQQWRRKHYGFREYMRRIWIGRD